MNNEMPLMDRFSEPILSVTEQEYKSVGWNYNRLGEKNISVDYAPVPDSHVVIRGYLHRDTFYIHSFCACPARKGIGSATLTVLKGKLQPRGIKVFVRDCSLSAFPFWQKMLERNVIDGIKTWGVQTRI